MRLEREECLSNVYNSAYNTLKKKTRSWATRLIKNHLDVRESCRLAHSVPNTYGVVYIIRTFLFHRAGHRRDLATTNYRPKTTLLLFPSWRSTFLIEFENAHYLYMLCLRTYNTQLGTYIIIRMATNIPITTTRTMITATVTVAERRNRDRNTVVQHISTFKL